MIVEYFIRLTTDVDFLLWSSYQVNKGTLFYQNWWIVNMSLSSSRPSCATVPTWAARVIIAARRRRRRRQRWRQRRRQRRQRRRRPTTTRRRERERNVRNCQILSFADFKNQICRLNISTPASFLRDRFQMHHAKRGHDSQPRAQAKSYALHR